METIRKSSVKAFGWEDGKLYITHHIEADIQCVLPSCSFEYEDNAPTDEDCKICEGLMHTPAHDITYTYTDPEMEHYNSLTDKKGKHIWDLLKKGGCEHG